MKILLLCEPRSGSTNLANWFGTIGDFTIFQEPLNIRHFDYKKGIPAEKWEFNTKNILIKEIYTKEYNLENLIKFSDKVILLYRENVKEQIESWLVASETDMWSSIWIPGRVRLTNEKLKREYFYSLKEEFKSKYLSDDSLFKISYEELYFNGGLIRILDYLNLEGIDASGFPYGKKYRTEKTTPKSLI